MIQLNVSNTVEVPLYLKKKYRNIAKFAVHSYV